MTTAELKLFQKKGKKKLENKSGFSLIEVLITLVILSVGIAAVSTLMTTNIRNSIDNKNQVIASELAQEALELVKNLKDNNSSVFAVEVTDGVDYRIDNLSTYQNFKGSAGNDKELLLDSDGFYSHSGTTETGFHRKVEIDIDVSRTVRVDSYVSWNPTGSFSPCSLVNRCIKVQAILPDLN
jgi:prepilin-type N-terminal cleavage/methylation domain-containing protein